MEVNVIVEEISRLEKKLYHKSSIKSQAIIIGDIECLIELYEILTGTKYPRKIEEFVIDDDLLVYLGKINQKQIRKFCDFEKDAIVRSYLKSIVNNVNKDYVYYSDNFRMPRINDIEKGEIISDFFKNYDPRVEKYFNLLLQSGRIFMINGHYRYENGDYDGTEMYLSKIAKAYIYLYDGINPIYDMGVIVHEVAHAYSDEILAKFNVFYDGNYTNNFLVEVYAVFMEKLFLYYLYEHHIYRSVALKTLKHNYNEEKNRLYDLKDLFTMGFNGINKDNTIQNFDGEYSTFIESYRLCLGVLYSEYLFDVYMKNKDVNEVNLFLYDIRMLDIDHIFAKYPLSKEIIKKMERVKTYE